MNGDIKLLIELVSRLSDDESDKLMAFIRSCHAATRENEQNQEFCPAFPDPA